MNINQEQFGEYTKHYNAGWKHSETAARPDLDKGVSYGRKHGTSREHQDFVTNSWEDGYLDSAAGREKYALRSHRTGTGSVEGY